MIESQFQHRIFKIACNRYVQHRERDPLPEEIVSYSRQHGGEQPAYIPVPPVPTEFDLGGRCGVPWNGESELPPEVMAYVVENGFLPRRSGDYQPPDEADDDSYDF